MSSERESKWDSHQADEAMVVRKRIFEILSAYASQKERLAIIAEAKHFLESPEQVVSGQQQAGDATSPKNQSSLTEEPSTDKACLDETTSQEEKRSMQSSQEYPDFFNEDIAKLGDDLKNFAELKNADADSILHSIVDLTRACKEKVAVLHRIRMNESNVLVNLEAVSTESENTEKWRSLIASEAKTIETDIEKLVSSLASLYDVLQTTDSSAQLSFDGIVKDMESSLENTKNMSEQVDDVFQQTLWRAKSALSCLDHDENLSQLTIREKIDRSVPNAMQQDFVEIYDRLTELFNLEEKLANIRSSAENVHFAQAVSYDEHNALLEENAALQRRLDSLREKLSEPVNSHHMIEDAVAEKMCADVRKTERAIRRVVRNIQTHGSRPAEVSRSVHEYHTKSNTLNALLTKNNRLKRALAKENETKISKGSDETSTITMEEAAAKLALATSELEAKIEHLEAEIEEQNSRKMRIMEDIDRIDNGVSKKAKLDKQALGPFSTVVQTAVNQAPTSDQVEAFPFGRFGNQQLFLA